MISNTLPLSLIDNPILSQWIAFEEPGRVRVGSGKVEIGQGILTALTQIAAEELDVGFDQVRLVSGADRREPGGRLHVGQLFGVGRRRLDPAGLCRGARAVPRPRGREARLPGVRVDHRKRQAAARRQGYRPRLLVACRRSGAGAPGERHRTGEAALHLPHRRAQRAARRPAREGLRRGVHPRPHAGRRRARPGAAAAVAWRAARGARRGMRCGAPPRNRSRCCARATSSPSRRRARPP